MKHRIWLEIAELAGVALAPAQMDTLQRYRDWLIEEAVVAGGLGPDEAQRIDARHIGDSLLFGVAMPYVPDELWDLGSGVGLPGIPLAILHPQTRVTLIERSGRRADLMERALRILQLPNAVVRRADVTKLEGTVDALVSRAALGPADTAGMARQLLSPEGFALMGGSWSEPPEHPEWETIEIRPLSLDHSVWILIMRGQ